MYIINSYDYIHASKENSRRKRKENMDCLCTMSNDDRDTFSLLVQSSNNIQKHTLIPHLIYLFKPSKTTTTTPLNRRRRKIKCMNSRYENNNDELEWWKYCCVTLCFSLSNFHSWCVRFLFHTISCRFCCFKIAFRINDVLSRMRIRILLHVKSSMLLLLFFIVILLFCGRDKLTAEKNNKCLSLYIALHLVFQYGFHIEISVPN